MSTEKTTTTTTSTTQYQTMGTAMLSPDNVVVPVAAAMANDNMNNNEKMNYHHYDDSTGRHVDLLQQQHPYSTTKRGHSCCGGCCDMRRAVIIVNSINIALFVVLFVLPQVLIWMNDNYANCGYDSYNYNNNNDNNMDDYFSNFNDYYYDYGVPNDITMKQHRYYAMVMMFVILLVIFSLGCSIVGIVGAIRYNKYMVGIATIPCIFAILSLNFGTFVIAAFFLYPHVLLIQEIHEGIMTKENYHDQERQSCCCV